MHLNIQILKSYLFRSLALFGLCLMPVLVSAKTIMILGDSLSAGYGIQPEQGWVNLLQKRLNQQVNIKNTSTIMLFGLIQTIQTIGFQVVMVVFMKHTTMQKNGNFTAIYQLFNFIKLQPIMLVLSTTFTVEHKTTIRWEDHHKLPT